MKYWPVIDSKSRKIPTNGKGGSFLEDRGDRFHCGIDIYANEGDSVVAIEKCEVLETGLFTSPEKVSYWNKTYYIIVKVLPQNEYCMVSEEDDELEDIDLEIKNKSFSLTVVYAELGEVFVKKGDLLLAGEKIATVGKVLNNDLIGENSPKYIQEIKANNNSSMLHFEMYINDNTLLNHNNYLGGNWFKNKNNKEIPKKLSDPTEYLENIN